MLALVLTMASTLLHPGVALAEIDEMEWGGAPIEADAKNVKNNAAVGRTVVQFESDGRKLEAFLYRPAGPGPFPAIVWNHGGEKHPNGAPTVARYAMTHGYVFFAPLRRGHGRSQGTYMGDALQGFGGEAKKKHLVELMDAEGIDVDEAVGYVRALRFVDKRNIFLFGCSLGASETILAADRNRHIRGAVAFSPGAVSFDANAYMRERLKAAVRAKHVPLLILQPHNDPSLGPARVLGPINDTTGMPSHTRVFGPYGRPGAHGNEMFCSEGTNAWGQEVLEFLAAAGVGLRR